LQAPITKDDGNLKALAQGFSALNNRVAFDSKLPKIRTWAHAKHWWAQAKRYTDSGFHVSTMPVGRFWTVAILIMFLDFVPGNKIQNHDSRTTPN
jgi:hypothetical protein